MKHLSVVFALAASSFCVVAHAAHAQNASTVVQPSLTEYERNMAEGRKYKEESAKSYSQSRSQQAAQAFFRARAFAPTSPQRAEALVEAGETLYSMAAMAAAVTAFRDALQEEITPALKGRALMGIADSEYHVAFMRGELAKYAVTLRNNYLEATKIHKANDAETAKVWQNLAKIADAEKKHLEAAQSYAKVLSIKSVERLWPYAARDAIEQLKKTTALSLDERKTAIALSDQVFAIYFPLQKDDAAKNFVRITQANLLAQLGEYSRAEKLRNEIANDAKVSEKQRAETLVQIAQRQVAQKKYDAALLTLDRLPQLSILYKTRHHLERGKTFLAQGKYDAATAEFFRVTITSESEEKVEGYWGLADVAEKEAATLRLKKAPATEIALKVEAQKSALTRASMVRDANSTSKRETYLKLAQFETAQGNAAEAKKWQDMAARRINSK